MRNVFQVLLPHPAVLHLEVLVLLVLHLEVLHPLVLHLRMFNVQVLLLSVTI
jgi:hypothetical protein